MKVKSLLWSLGSSFSGWDRSRVIAEGPQIASDGVVFEPRVVIAVFRAVCGRVVFAGGRPVFSSDVWGVRLLVGAGD
jgi:hypothetical protein